MGQNAVYIAIDDETAEQMWALDDDLFRARVLEIEEDERFPQLDIAKIWDVMHCTLTGVSASRPIEGDKLSEAVVGVHPKEFGDGDDSAFVSITDLSELDEIVAALDAVEQTERLDLQRLREELVYPHGIWNDDPAILVREVTDTLVALRGFLADARARGAHVLATFM